MKARFLNWRWRRYQCRCQAQFADALAMLAGGLRAGLNLPQAIALVAGDGPEPLRAEFARVVAATHVGMSVDQGVEQLARRVGGEDARALHFAVIVLFETGGNLIETFEGLGTIIRDRERVRSRVRLLTMQGLATGVIIALLPLLLWIGMAAVMPHWLAPLFTTWVGRGCVFVGLMLQGIGLWWMRRVVKVQI